MINKVELRWWKSHEHTVLEFSKGTNVLLGINGSGKSSVMQAISFALFGEVPEVKSRKIKITDLIMRKPRRMERAVVSLEFSTGDAIYRVERSISKEGSDARLFKEGRIIEVGARRVSEKIEEILGIDFDTFVQVIYARQNELDYFLRAGKTERVTLIDKILKIDKIAEAKENLRGFKRTIEGEISSLRIIAGKDVEKLEKEREEIKEEIEKLRQELEKKKMELEILGEEKEKLEKIDAEMEEKRRKIEELKKISKELEGKIGILAERIAGLPKVENASFKLQEITEKLSKARENLLELKMRSGKIEGERRELERRLEEIKSMEEIARQEVQDYREEIEKMRNELSRAEAEISLHKNAIEQLKKAEARCPVCNSPLANKEEHISRHRKVIQELESHVSKLREHLNELVEKQREAERRKVEIEKAKEIVKNKEEILEKLEMLKQVNIADEVTKAKEIVEKLEEERKIVERAVEREELEEKLRENRKRLAEISAELEKIVYDPGKHEEIKRKLREVISKFFSLKTEILSIPQRIKDKEAINERIAREIEEVKKAREELKIKEKTLENLKVLLNALDDVQVVVRRNFVEVVNELLSDIWSKLYPYGDYSGLRINIESNGVKAGDYVLQIRERRGWVNVDGIASGGERSLAALALRVAFAKALANIGLLLLDEPTHNLDSNAIEKLIQVLREGIPEVLDQVLLITHEEEMEKASTGRAYRLYRDKDREEPTIVEQL